MFNPENNNIQEETANQHRRETQSVMSEQLRGKIKQLFNNLTSSETSNTALQTETEIINAHEQHVAHDNEHFDKNQSPTLEEYLKDAKRNLMKMSRTAQGVVDTSASAKKAESMTGVNGQEAANLAQQNFEQAIAIAFENKDKEFSSPEELRQFVEELASTINTGIVKEGSLIRTADSDKYPYVRVANLETYMQQFYQQLHQRLSNKESDAVESAAFAEFGIDLAGHFFADGCGKTSKVASSYILMRNDHALPEYRDRKEYYSNSQLQQIAGQNETADAISYQKFLEYYRTLFKEN